MLNFLKSLVLPTYMSRYRHVSVLLSLCILILTCYLFSLPIGNYYLNNSEQFLQSNEPVMQPLLQMPKENDRINKISADLNAMGISFSDNNITIKEDLGKNYEYSESASYDVVIKELDEKGKVVTEDGVEKTKTEHVNLFVYVYFNEEKGFNESDLYKSFNEIPLEYDADGNLINKPYMIAFTKTAIIYQIGQKIEITDENKANYSEKDIENYNKASVLAMPLSAQILFSTLAFDPVKLTNEQPFGMEVARVLSFNLVASNYMVYVLVQLLSSCLLFPLIIVLLFWLFFKKNGKLKTFREYLNIAAFSSIVPALVVFIIAWFYAQIIDFYVYPFAIFFLFNVYKINSTTDLV